MFTQSGGGVEHAMWCMKCRRTAAWSWMLFSKMSDEREIIDEVADQVSLGTARKKFGSNDLRLGQLSSNIIL